MRKNMIFGLVVALAVAFPALSYSRVYIFNRTNINFLLLISQLETATGLVFEAKCPTCVQNGTMGFNGSVLDVSIYESTDPSNIHVSSVTWSQGLENTIINTVNAHAP